MSPVAEAVSVRWAEARLAMMVLTRFPVGTIAGRVLPVSAACWAFPLAGLAVGASAALMLAGALALRLPAGIAAGLALTAGIVATGALHEDGLADVADGFGGGRDRQRKLEIMRDSRIGTYGALALLLVVGLRWMAVATLVAVDPELTLAALIAIAAASRAGLPAVLAFVPPARADGLGHAASAPGTARWLVAAVIGAASLILLLGPLPALMLGIAQAVVLVLGARLARHHIGGQNGDVLGALQQIADLTGWLVVSAAVHW